MVKKRTQPTGSGAVSDAELQRRIDEFAAAADGGQPPSTPVDSGNEKKNENGFFYCTRRGVDQTSGGGGRADTSIIHAGGRTAGGVSCAGRKNLMVICH